jgi:transposase
VHQAERDAGQRSDGLTSAEREELGQLRREVRRLKVEREIMARATAWFARETGTIPPASRGDSGS